MQLGKEKKKSGRGWNQTHKLHAVRPHSAFTIQTLEGKTAERSLFFLAAASWSRMLSVGRESSRSMHKSWITFGLELRLSVKSDRDANRLDEPTKTSRRSEAAASWSHLRHTMTKMIPLHQYFIRPSRSMSRLIRGGAVLTCGDNTKKEISKLCENFHLLFNQVALHD